MAFARGRQAKGYSAKALLLSHHPGYYVRREQSCGRRVYTLHSPEGPTHHVEKTAEDAWESGCIAILGMERYWELIDQAREAGRYKSPNVANG